MPLARLRRILDSELRVRIDSSQALLDRVQQKVADRQQQLQAKNQAIPEFKPATRLQQFDGMDWQVRPIRLLHKLGRMTTPQGLGNMAKLSAGWATRRYFWAIAEATAAQPQFRLSADAMELDFHQKGLLSDEFGVGMAGLFMEEHLSAPETMDISLALRNEFLAQQIAQTGDTQPDYLMWSSGPNGKYYVVECKGCQSGRAESANQLRRGLEQLISIQFADAVRADAVRNGSSFVIATCLSAAETVLYLIDPPPEEDRPKREFRGEEVSVRLAARNFRVPNMQAFDKRSRVAKAAQVLQWAGENNRAIAVREHIEPVREEGRVPDLPSEQREIAGVRYRGPVIPLFPELSPALRVFFGVDQELLASAEQYSEVPGEISEAVEGRSRASLPEATHFESISLDGTCMSIEGLAL